jgi:hypothetical protein
MPQFLRPDSNITQTNWTGGFADIDEATASDADFSYGANNSNSATLEVGLSNPSVPDSGTCTVRWRYAKVSSGTLSGTGGTVNQTCGVYQGATLIASSTVTTGGSWTAGSFTFNTSSISDWTNVRLRFTQTASGGGGNARGSAVSWAEIEIPDAPPIEAEADLTASGTIGLTVQRIVPATASLSGSSAIGLEADILVDGFRETESGDRRVTESGDRRITENFSPPTGALLDADATLSGSGTFTSAMFYRRDAASSLSAAGTTAYIASLTRNASVTLVGSLAQLSASTLSVGAVSALSSSATITAGADVATNVASSLSASGSVQGKLGFQFSETRSLSGQGTITANGLRSVPAASTLSGSASLASIALVTRPASAGLSSVGSVAGTASVTVSPSVSGQAVGTIVAQGVRIQQLSSSLQGQSDFGISPQIIRLAVTLVGSQGILEAEPISASNIFSSLSSTGSLNGILDMIHSAEFKSPIEYRVTESGDPRITEEGEFRIVDSGVNKGLSTGSGTATVIPFVAGIYARRGGSWKQVDPRVYRSGAWVTPKVYVKNNGIWKRVY